MKVNNLVLSFALFLTDCPIAIASDQSSPKRCVIDRCEDEICVVETPEGTVEIPKKRHYKEGLPIVCPLWLIEPT